MFRKIILYLFLFNVYPVKTAAQEVITGLQSNHVITGGRGKQVKNQAIIASDTLEIPFFDDFAQQSAYPDIKRWSDDFVFINNTYSDKQPTTGIATLDAIDNSGRLYETASSSLFQADILTSQTLDLNYPATDNLFLSFFYQSGGLGDSPEAIDSLTLQFFAPDENKWYSVWKTEGYTSQLFKPAILKIDNTRFLKRGFKFRFINYASLSKDLSDPSMVGNCDIWNIDYVLLDKNRNTGDTIFADVAFRLPLRSILKNHEAMPWDQFKKVYLQEMGSLIPVSYRNNDIITRNVTRDFQIWDEYNNLESHFFSAGATNINPLTNIDYNANLIYTFNTTYNDSALFRITCSLKTDEFDPKENDTLKYFQRFNNYFAFDDGSSEGGYGINGLGSRNAMVARRFESFMDDTIRAIKICFNDSYLNANQRAFDLMIWDDNNDKPGNVIYSQEEVLVEQADKINGFYTYIIQGDAPVNSIFYVGWKQRSETFLNAGFDVNTPHNGKQLYWLNGEWRSSQVNGSIMIRPVVGDPLKILSIDDSNIWKRKQINVWPNPANDFLNISPGELRVSGFSEISIFDIYGRKVLQVPYLEQIDITSLHNGLYIILISVDGKTIGYNRFIKTR